MKKKKVIVAILIIITLLFIVFKYKRTEVEGEYTGYQLILTAQYNSGNTINLLGSGRKKKIFNISENDTFYERK